MTCGIGSMLIGARTVGFNVLGNVEWRRYYHATDDEGRNTFTENFPDAFFVKTIDDIPLRSCMPQIDLLMGHPECGNFSQLSNANPTRLQKLADAADIPLFVDNVAALKPRFFVMDDLPKSLGAFPMDEYMKRLPDYDLFPEWISNYHYGNPQKNRKRMFMIGALKEERFTFVPGERNYDMTVGHVLADIAGKYDGSIENHYRHVLNRKCGKAKHMTGHSHVLDGGSPAINPVTCVPFTLRERLRIQGAPDTFVLYGEVLESNGRWDHYRNIHLVKQTGKFMPVQFCVYVAEQIRAHIDGRKFTCSRDRLISQNQFVTDAKWTFCQQTGGYSNQKGACDACWIDDCHLVSCARIPDSGRIIKTVVASPKRPVQKKKKKLRKYECPSGKTLTNM
jgi:site-specific DNA-cytosine methylase